MGWWVFGAWLGAVLFAAAVLGFCAYELTWKGRRLATDLEKLSAVSGRLDALQAEVESVQAGRHRAQILLTPST